MDLTDLMGLKRLNLIVAQLSRIEQRQMIHDGQLKEIYQMAEDYFKDIADQIARNASATNSAIEFIRDIVTKLHDASGLPAGQVQARVKELASQLGANTDKLAASLVENTASQGDAPASPPPAPVADPVPAPVETAPAPVEVSPVPLETLTPAEAPKPIEG